MFGFKKDKYVEKQINDVNVIRSQVRDEIELRRNEIELIELQELIGQLVICVSNECENITVGYGKEITFLTKAQQPFLIVHDLIAKKDILPLGKIFVYTEQKFDALNNMDANARIALIYNPRSDVTVDKNEGSDYMYPAAEWKKKVDVAISEYMSNFTHQQPQF